MGHISDIIMWHTVFGSAQMLLQAFLTRGQHMTSLKLKILLSFLFFLNLDLTEDLDNLSFLKRMNRCWQDHCRQTVGFNVSLLKGRVNLC